MVPKPENREVKLGHDGPLEEPAGEVHGGDGRDVRVGGVGVTDTSPLLHCDTVNKNLALGFVFSHFCR